MPESFVLRFVAYTENLNTDLFQGHTPIGSNRCRAHLANLEYFSGQVLETLAIEECRLQCPERSCPINGRRFYSRWCFRR